MKRQDYAITISNFNMEVPGGIVKGTRLDISKPTGENKIQFIHIYNNDDLLNECVQIRCTASRGYGSGSR